MSEPLFNRSKAVADLNRVDGFDPMELARLIQNDGQEPQLYLDVKFRKLWFRLCNPRGKISKKILSLQENMAVVEAKIYLDKDDPEEGYIASALSQKFRTDDPQFGNKFLETAEPQRAAPWPTQVMEFNSWKARKTTQIKWTLASHCHKDIQGMARQCLCPICPEQCPMRMAQEILD